MVCLCSRRCGAGEYLSATTGAERRHALAWHLRPLRASAAPAAEEAAAPAPIVEVQALRDGDVAVIRRGRRRRGMKGPPKRRANAPRLRGPPRVAGIARRVRGDLRGQTTSAERRSLVDADIVPGVLPTYRADAGLIDMASLRDLFGVRRPALGRREGA
jgi:hypothetical protein